MGGQGKNIQVHIFHASLLTLRLLLEERWERSISVSVFKVNYCTVNSLNPWVKDSNPRKHLNTSLLAQEPARLRDSLFSDSEPVL